MPLWERPPVRIPLIAGLDLVAQIMTLRDNWSGRGTYDSALVSMFLDPDWTTRCTNDLRVVRQGGHTDIGCHDHRSPELSVSEARERFAAVIDADDLDRVLELAQDMADIREAERAREQMRATGQVPVPWDEVRADLGLV